MKLNLTVVKMSMQKRKSKLFWCKIKSISSNHKPIGPTFTEWEKVIDVIDKKFLAESERISRLINNCTDSDNLVKLVSEYNELNFNICKGFPELMGSDAGNVMEMPIDKDYASYYVEFCSIINRMKSKFNGGRSETTAESIGEMKEEVNKAIMVADRTGFIKSDMVKGIPSRLTKWFQLYNDSEKEKLIRKVDSMSNKELSRTIKAHLYPLENSTETRANKFQICYCLEAIKKCVQAGLSKEDIETVGKKLAFISKAYPIKDDDWQTLIESDHLIKKVDDLLFKGEMNLHSPPNQINRSRMNTGIQLLFNGICDLTPLCCDMSLNEKFKCVVELSRILGTPENNEVTNSVEHLAHQLVICSAGDPKRFRNNLTKKLADIRVKVN